MSLLVIKIHSPKTKDKIIGIVYQPPNNKYNRFEEHLTNVLGHLNKEDKDTFIIGDFNLNLLKMNSSDYVNDFVTQMYASSFYPLITKPTRITKYTATLIDNIFVNNVSKICKKGIIISDLSDHLPIFCTTNQAFETTTQTEKNKRIVNKRYINQLKEHISKINPNL